MWVHKYSGKFIFIDSRLFNKWVWASHYITNNNKDHNNNTCEGYHLVRMGSAFGASERRQKIANASEFEWAHVN